MMDHPLKKAMNKLEVVGRLIQWAIELSDGVEETKAWVVHVDGSSTLYVGGIGIVLKFPEGDKLRYVARL